MECTERMSLIRALMAASNAFHKELREHGYEVSYGGDTKTGSIRRQVPPPETWPESWPVGKLTICWELEKEE